MTRAPGSVDHDPGEGGGAPSELEGVAPRRTAGGPIARDPAELVSPRDRYDADACPGTSFLFQPTFSDLGDLHDMIGRAAFYLGGVELERVFFIVDGPVPERFELPQELDPGIESMVLGLWPRLCFVRADDELGQRDALAASSAILRWREEAGTSSTTAMDKQTWNVDKHAHRMEGSAFLDAAFHSHADPVRLIRRNERAFTQLVEKLGAFARAYVFGTGPSAARYGEFDFSDGLGIVSNTIIKDDALMAHVRPRILAFSDPIFHFGCSKYAATFRELVVQVAEKYDLIIVIPINYYAHLSWLCPALEARLIGVPLDAALQVNTDLTKRFAVPPLDNILTLLLLPLAATFADQIHIIGCDGRDPGERRFWQHNATTQLGDLMENLHSTHPSFFKLNYEDYYQRHCDNLERWLASAEQQGIIGTSMVESRIPALRKRYRR